MARTKEAMAGTGKAMAGSGRAVACCEEATAGTKQGRLRVAKGRVGSRAAVREVHAALAQATFAGGDAALYELATGRRQLSPQPHCDQILVRLG